MAVSYLHCLRNITTLSQPLTLELHNHIVTAVTLIEMHVNHMIQTLHSSSWKDIFVHCCCGTLHTGIRATILHLYYDMYLDNSKV